MISLLFATLALTAGKPETAPTLAGVTLGSNLAQLLSKHSSAKPSARSSQRFAWSRNEGGEVTVTVDDSGDVTRVDFVASDGRNDAIDLPCVGSFPVQDSHVNLEHALSKTPCSAFNGLTYGLPDHSLVQVRFDGSSDGHFIEATWYRPSDNNPSPVGQLAAVIDYLRPALTYVGGVARIYYAGECPVRDNSGLMQPLDFPSVWLQAPLPGATGVRAVQQIFSDDPSVMVAQDRSGMMRITIGSVASTILQMKVPTLTLSPIEQYTALSALDNVAGAADVYARQRGLPFGLGPTITDHLVSGPSEGAAHLPSTMQNITIDEALDELARTFKGIVTYGVCKQPDGKSLFRLHFIHGS
ncbi:MAG TPA: hypothetical protein VFE16_12270 [Candidatus Cybelea sp.]|jgi:hypothetical protein|nr:hypothetical protein [Candidatus Cybelea sp.]